ncbi:hypothetical protein D5H78_00625 [Vallicoccus soli]|uniref:Ig-like domain-containing protein n=1 Tax=Vallicoccus soli TaxID=2339232 RepID=A0A3A3Z6M8_9ACTN|nr:hypothetical protein [Vallicoccus soli]RJK97577.1 hypothetical protein D5H78_00625 [Vallicoccus soli]
MDRRSARRVMVGVLAGLTAVTVAPAAASAAPAAVPVTARAAERAAEQAAEQTLVWTADNSVTDYKSAPATAVAGETTIVFENSTATGNTIAMPHTLTFDTSTPGYNHDVALNILANPFDANQGRHEATVTLTPGTYLYFCSIPGHGQMRGELVVTGEGGGGDEDTTAPEVTAEVTGEQDGDGAYVGSATVALTATDEEGGSGVASVEYALDGGGWTAYGEPVVVDAPGEHTLTYRATDTAGNASETGSTTFTVVEGGGGGEEDTTAPEVTAEVSGERDADGAYVGSATLALTATDEGSGVASIEYDAHGGHWMPYTEPVVFSEPGEHTVSYRATDEAGNVSETGSTTFTVVEGGGGGEEDTTAPEVTAEVSGQQDASGAYVGSAAVTVTAADEGSGVASVEYDLDGAGWQPYTGAVVIDGPGEHTLSYRATDEAGNVSEDGSVTVTVVAADPGDTEAPSVSARLTGARNAAGEYLTATVQLSASDGDSGVEKVEFQLDGGAWTRYANKITVTAAGEHVLAYRATDVAGNVSAPQTLAFAVASRVPADTTAPEVTAAVGGSRNGDGAFVGRASVQVTATDAGSGVGTVEVQVDGGAWQRYAAPVVLVGDGDHTVAYRATDVAGNASRTRSVTFTVVTLARDACPGSDVRPTVVIGGHDSTVENKDDGEGCTVNDHIAEGGDHASHRAFLQHVKAVTSDLTRGKVISWAERRRIVAAATLSDVGRS